MTLVRLVQFDLGLLRSRPNNALQATCEDARA